MREHFDFTKNKILIMILWLNIESLFLVLFLTLSSRSVAITLCLLGLRFLFFSFNSLLSLEKKELFFSSFYFFSIIFMVNMMDSLSVLESESESESRSEKEKDYHNLENKLFIVAAGILVGGIIYITLNKIDNELNKQFFKESDLFNNASAEKKKMLEDCMSHPLKLDLFCVCVVIGASVAYVISKNISWKD